MSKMSQESQVNLNFADYDKLGLRLSAILISLQSEEKQVWPVGCPRAGCKISRRQKWQRHLILKNQTVCYRKIAQSTLWLAGWLALGYYFRRQRGEGKRKMGIALWLLNGPIKDVQCKSLSGFTSRHSHKTYS